MKITIDTDKKTLEFTGEYTIEQLNTFISDIKNEDFLKYKIIKERISLLTYGNGYFNGNTGNLTIVCAG